MDGNALLVGHRRRAKNATSAFHRVARKAAYAQAALDAEREARDIETTWREEQTAWQALLDREWAELRRNEPDTVLNTLAQAFSDNEAVAAAVGIDGAELTVVVVVPPPTLLPERRPTLTPAGNLSLKKLSKRELSELYKTLVCGHLLVTVKEAFAVAPSVTSIKAVVVRPTTLDPYPDPKGEVLVAAEFQRSRLQGDGRESSDSIRAFDEVAGERLFVTRGATRELVPVDLEKEPQLAEIAEAIDFEDLLGG